MYPRLVTVERSRKWETVQFLYSTKIFGYLSPFDSSFFANISFAWFRRSVAFATSRITELSVSSSSRYGVVNSDGEKKCSFKKEKMMKTARTTIKRCTLHNWVESGNLTMMDAQYLVPRTCGKSVKP